MPLPLSDLVNGPAREGTKGSQLFSGTLKNRCVPLSLPLSVLPPGPRPVQADGHQHDPSLAGARFLAARGATRSRKRTSGRDTIADAWPRLALLSRSATDLRNKGDASIFGRTEKSSPFPGPPFLGCPEPGVRPRCGTVSRRLPTVPPGPTRGLPTPPPPHHRSRSAACQRLGAVQQVPGGGGKTRMARPLHQCLSAGIVMQNNPAFAGQKGCP